MESKRQRPRTTSQWSEGTADVLVIGGGLGGVAAALAVARTGRSVILAEAGHWLGGQLTSQGVPADEHEWIENFGATASYRALRDGIREHYRRFYPLTSQARSRRYLSPGASLVSSISCEPRAALAVIESMLAPYRAGGLLRVLLGHEAVSMSWNGDRCEAVALRDRATGTTRTITAGYVIDATETGELLDLGGIEHVTGAEGSDATGEPHATSREPRPLDMQSITWIAALGLDPSGGDHTIDKPEQYERWAAYRADFETGPHLSWSAVAGMNRYSLLGDAPDAPFSLWKYRRALFAGHFDPSAGIEDVTLLNAPQNDYWNSPVVGVDQDARATALAEARQLTLSAVYWLQTAAPRPDGGVGYPSIRVRPDIFGTSDGLALEPYIRESRRIVAEFTVLEQHVGVDARGDATSAERFADSVGIGAYRLDLHSTTGGFAGLNLPAWPFQIPLGALVPVRAENVLPACKNIGTTQITNGCYRLHPVEWNIGEAAGALASFCLDRAAIPRQVRSDGAMFADFEKLLRGLGVETDWPSLAPARSYYKAHAGDPDWTWGESSD